MFFSYQMTANWVEASLTLPRKLAFPDGVWDPQRFQRTVWSKLPAVGSLQTKNQPIFWNMMFRLLILDFFLMAEFETMIKPIRTKEGSSGVFFQTLFFLVHVSKCMWFTSCSDDIIQHQPQPKLTHFQRTELMELRCRFRKRLRRVQTSRRRRRY